MRLSTLAFAVILGVGCAHPSSAPRSNGRSIAMAYVPSADGNRELLPDEQVQQVLNRLGFGARPGDAAKVRAMGVDKWIQTQLHPESIPDDANARIIARYPSRG